MSICLQRVRLEFICSAVLLEFCKHVLFNLEFEGSQIGFSNFLYYFVMFMSWNIFVME